MSTRAWLRPLAIGLAIAGAAVFARWHWDRLTDPQSPRALFDSNIYLEIAARPLGIEQLFYTKPPTVPLVYRASARDPATIVRVQRELAFAAWAALSAALAIAMRRRALRVAAVGAGIAFLLAAPRVGWTGALLSESLDDSLAALVIACAIGLAVCGRRPARIALVVALGGLGLAWLFSRDTNAIAALVAVGVAALVWPVRRWWRTRRWAVALAGLAVAGSLVALWSSRVVPEPLPYQATWYTPLTARAGYPLLDNVLSRMMRDDRAWLAERGAPVAALDPFTGAEPRPDLLVQRHPPFEPVQRWLIEHGDTTYLHWLVRHPLDRIGELIGARWLVLAGHHGSAMPTGWIARDPAHPLIELLRGLTTQHWLLLALIAASPLVLRRPRSAPITGIALCMFISGVAAAAASYYGDAAELARHCYGAGQQIVVGLVIALLGWLDQVRWRPRVPAMEP